jgi:aerobic-type carbon monoxide dehydrogenase small subunit (CoxS/CutS family)
MAVEFTLNGEAVSVDGDAGDITLLEALRGRCGITSAKDGCAPQGQCGCCTVLVDGRARVSCVTPLRRVSGRSVETVEGLPGGVARAWAQAFLDCGGSQCGFCTPGIVMRLEERRRATAGAGSVSAGGASAGAGARPGDVAPAVERALQAHLCRCTGWHGVVRAAGAVLAGRPCGGGDEGGGGTGRARDDTAAARRAAIEGGVAQRVDAAAVLGRGGFSADTAPPGALVAVPAADGSWVVAESLVEARRSAGKVQGRRTTLPASPPLEVPPGEWDAVLRTSWVEPAYLETDAAWCEPGGEPSTTLANGGAFGAKADSPLPGVARALADEHGRAVLVVWSREDVVRHGAKRPPVAGGMLADGTGVLRVAATPGVDGAVALAAPGLAVQQVPMAGPPTSAGLRAAGWAEALCLSVAAGAPSPLGGPDGAGVRVQAPGGGWARVAVDDDGFDVVVGPGDPLDEAVLRSYVEGACHMAAGWVCSEALAVGTDGEVHDLTIRSFGVLRAADTPTVRVGLDAEGSTGAPVGVGDAVFAACAAALWRHRGTPPSWPVGMPVLGGAARAAG